MAEVAHHPVQMPAPQNAIRSGQLPAVVTLRAYEIYVALYGAQEAMVSGGCRGGFSIGEITAFLYARSFPKEEWRRRVDEALRGMKLHR